MELHVGTSGYSYKEWKGSFYPEDLPAKEMLRYYSERFSTVEINNTFYRMPAPKLFEQWMTQVPPSFRFGIKAPQTITHRKRLSGTDEEVDYLIRTASVLGEQLGPILFQMPPYFHRDAEVLRRFVSHLPRDRKCAFEFRHASWEDDEICKILREADCALCLSHTDEDPADVPIVPTASWGYLRLRRVEYTDEELAAWRRKVASQSWNEAYVFFKHEDEGKGPEFAQRFLAT